MIEKPKRPKKLNNQDRKIPINIQELINRYDLENTDIYDYLDRLVSSELINYIYPVGTIYLSINNINPSTFLGGTWELWGQGKTIVGVDSGDTDFNLSEKTGGEKTHTLTINEVPSNNILTTSTGGIVDGYISRGGYTANGSYNFGGGGQPHNIMQPYITCYMWKRVI